MNLIVNDLHLDLRRRSGVTPASLAAFQQYKLEGLRQTLQDYPGVRLIVLGDLFDTDNVQYETLQALAGMFKDDGREILLVKGNHDQVKDRAQVDALSFLAWMMPNCRLIAEPRVLDGDIAVVPHLANQALFDEAVATLAKDCYCLLAHCNYNNLFAEEQDHSLNLTPQQASEFEQVLLGHEHAKRTVGNVHVLGSMWPCSVLEARDEHHVHLWTPGVPPTPLRVWPTDPTSYQEVDWRYLSNLIGSTDTAQFLRVVGEAAADEAISVLQVIQRLRAGHPAFMISNAVSTGRLELGTVAEDIDNDLEGFDPVALFRSVVPEQFKTRLEGFLR